MKYKNVYKKTDLPFMPYVYLVKHIPSGKVYYGSRTSKFANPLDFFKHYFTSSELIHSLLESGGTKQFIFQIRRVFETKELCSKWEQTVLRRMNVRNHDSFLNKDDCQHLADNTGLIKISNRETGKCISIKASSPIPDGWYKGNINANRNPHSRGRKWFHNKAGECYMYSTHEEAIIDGFEFVGRGPKYVSNSTTLKNKKMHWYTNGVETLYCAECPSGWKPGRTYKS